MAAKEAAYFIGPKHAQLLPLIRFAWRVERGLSLPHHCRKVVVDVTLCLRPPSRRQALSLTEVTATSEALCFREGQMSHVSPKYSPTLSWPSQREKTAKSKKKATAEEEETLRQRRCGRAR